MSPGLCHSQTQARIREARGRNPAHVHQQKKVEKGRTCGEDTATSPHPTFQNTSSRSPPPPFQNPGSRPESPRCHKSTLLTPRMLSVAMPAELKFDPWWYARSSSWVRIYWLQAAWVKQHTNTFLEFRLRLGWILGSWGGGVQAGSLGGGGAGMVPSQGLMSQVSIEYWVMATAGHASLVVNPLIAH